MTNTERILANNADLQECIELAESLPDAGSGIEFLPITLTYGDNTFEPDYYTVGMALQDAMGGNGNKYPVIVNNVFGNGGPCIFCGVDMDGFPVFCALEPAENEDTGESTHLRFAYVLRPDNTFVYTLLGDLRDIFDADANASSFAGSDQVVKGYAYIDINTGDIKEGTYEPEDLTAELTEYFALNTELESVIDSLPSAGGGSAVETCTVSLNDPGLTERVIYDAYRDGAVTSVVVSRQGTISFVAQDVVKGGTMVFVANDNLELSDEDNYTVEFDGTAASGNIDEYIYVVRVTGDCTVYTG